MTSTFIVCRFICSCWEATYDSKGLDTVVSWQLSFKGMCSSWGCVSSWTKRLNFFLLCQATALPAEREEMFGGNFSSQIGDDSAAVTLMFNL